MAERPEDLNLPNSIVNRFVANYDFDDAFNDDDDFNDNYDCDDDFNDIFQQNCERLSARWCQSIQGGQCSDCKGDYFNLN